MHQEVLKPKVISAATNYCLLALIALLALFVAPFAHSRLLPNSQYAVYAAIMVIALVIVKWQLTEYRYSIIVNELIFDKMFGKRNRKLAVINLSQIKSFGRYRDLRSERAKTIVYTMKPKKSAYAIMIESQGQNVRIVFHPSEKMVRCIEHRIACECCDAADICK